MGLSASSDEFCYRSDQIVQGLPGILKLVDDILVFAATEDELLSRIKLLLDRCRQHGLTLSRKKIQIGSSVDFAGYKVTADGIMPDSNKVAAIRNFLKPFDFTRLRSFLRLCN